MSVNIETLLSEPMWTFVPKAPAPTLAPEGNRLASFSSGSQQQNSSTASSSTATALAMPSSSAVLLPAHGDLESFDVALRSKSHALASSQTAASRTAQAQQKQLKRRRDVDDKLDAVQKLLDNALYHSCSSFDRPSMISALSEAHTQLSNAVAELSPGQINTAMSVKKAVVLLHASMHDKNNAATSRAAAAVPAVGSSSSCNHLSRFAMLNTMTLVRPRVVESEADAPQTLTLGLATPAPASAGNAEQQNSTPEDSGIRMEEDGDHQRDDGDDDNDDDDNDEDGGDDGGDSSSDGHDDGLRREQQMTRRDFGSSSSSSSSSDDGDDDDGGSSGDGDSRSDRGQNMHSKKVTFDRSASRSSSSSSSSRRSSSSGGGDGGGMSSDGSQHNN